MPLLKQSQFIQINIHPTMTLIKWTVHNIKRATRTPNSLFKILLHNGR
jgi:hypothetical protein